MAELGSFPGSSNDGAKPIRKNCDRSRSPSRPPTKRFRSRSPEPARPEKPPHVRLARNLFHKKHICASCEDELPTDSKTGWENWVFIGPGDYDHEANVLVDRVLNLVHLGKCWVNRNLMWKDVVYGSYLPLCKCCMFKMASALFENNRFKSRDQDDGHWAYYESEKQTVELQTEINKDRAIIAAFLGQQLRDKYQNARHSIRMEEAKLAAVFNELCQIPDMK